MKVERTMRIAAVAVPVGAGGLAMLALGLASFTRHQHPPVVLVGVALMLVAAAVAERFPVRLGAFGGSVSVAFIFSVAGVVLFGWSAGALVAVGTAIGGALSEREPPPAALLRCPVHVLAAAGSGFAASATIGHGLHASRLVVAVAAAAAAHHAATAVLGVLMAAAHGGGAGAALRASVRQLLVPIPLMASGALMFVVLWQRSPALTAALIGPLAALELYNRSSSSADRAMQLALTDSLTGLGNARHFQQRFAIELRSAIRARRPFALCLVDLDDFKRINDTYGHPTGDRVLTQLAARFRQDGDAFRLGGDEFALLLPGYDQRGAQEIARAVVERISGTELEHGIAITVSAGIACYPNDGNSRDALVRIADAELYSAKQSGKSRVGGVGGASPALVRSLSALG
jgi:diguanylate cyclase (GGDEF)-like protein